MKSVWSRLWAVLAAGLAVAPAAAEPVRHAALAVVKAVEPEQFRAVLEVRFTTPGATVRELTAGMFPGDLALLSPGLAIRGQLVENEGKFRFERVFPDDPAADRLIAETARRLRLDTVERGGKVFRALGEGLPEFAFYDQRGRVLTHRELRGVRTVVSFIFTRCKVQAMCPATTRKMVELQARCAAAGLTDTQFVVFSFDPAYDTPGVLHQYAADYGAQPGNLFFLTGPPQATKDLLAQFGVQTRNADGTIDHTLQTFLVDADGKIAYRRDGSRWTADEFFERLAPKE